MIFAYIACGVLAGLILLGRVLFAEIREDELAEAQRRAAIIKRANQQHRWAMRGDPRGTYGRYPPAALK